MRVRAEIKGTVAFHQNSFELLFSVPPCLRGEIGF
jgi:hypothetical protein